MKNELPRIGLIGYGAMGKEIEKTAIKKGFIVAEKFDFENPLTAAAECDFDVAIDFSIPKAVVENTEILAKKKIDIVIGATGWYSSLPIIERIAKENEIGIIWASNFSIGMNIFMKITQIASQLINIAPDDFDIFINEIHHRRKKDSPSGSAISLANIILKEFSRKEQFQCGNCDGEISPDTLHISSTRGGEITGIHSIFIDSLADTIELTHKAKTRQGFADGALLASAWIAGKKGLFRFDDVFDKIHHIE